MDAIGSASVEAVELLIKEGADVNEKRSAERWVFQYDGGPDVSRPLVQAVIWEQTELVKLLLINGANVDTRGYMGWTALKAAGLTENKEIVRLLKAHGAVEQREKDTTQMKSLEQHNVRYVLVVFVAALLSIPCQV